MLFSCAVLMYCFSCCAYRDWIIVGFNGTQLVYVKLLL